MRKVFEQPGKVNTDKTLSVLTEAIQHHSVKQVVVASTYGDTALAAAELLEGSPVRLIVITHNYGFKEFGSHEMPVKTRDKLLAMGAKVYSGTMPFRNIGTSIQEKLGYSQQDLIANTLRLFGQGMKVCVEIVLMAADAGLIDQENVLAVAGTVRGADTVALIKPQSSNRLFDMQVLDILAKPIKW